MGPTKCKSCSEEIIFIKTNHDRTMPVNWESLNPVDRRNYSEGIPILFDAKRGHVSHFATCPAADSFRRKKSKSTKAAK